MSGFCVYCGYRHSDGLPCVTKGVIENLRTARGLLEKLVRVGPLAYSEGYTDPIVDLVVEAKKFLGNRND